MDLRALTLVAALAPWLVLLPIANAAIAVMLFVCALAASFHGWGLAFRTTSPATSSMVWGIAAFIGLSGIALALGIYTTPAAAAIFYVGIALHTLVLLLRVVISTFGPPPRVLGWGWYLAPCAALVAIGTIAILGSAGDLAGRPFDDDGNLLGALRRLADTGALNDGFGYPRAFQLGGHAALAALANVAGDARLLRMFEGFAFSLVMAGAISRIRPRDTHGALIATMVVLTGSALAIVVADPVPMWLGACLMIAALDETTPPLAMGAVCGALIALRHAYAPFAIVALVRRRSPRAGLAAFVVVAPYVVSVLRMADHASIGGSGFAKLGIALAIAVAALPICVLALSDWRGLAVAAGMGGIAAQLTGDHAGRYAWAIAITCVVVLAVDMAHRRTVTRAQLLTLVMALLMYEGRDVGGRAGWFRRTSDLIDGVGLLVHAPLVRVHDLDAILSDVPPDAVVALYVAEPWRFDYARHRLVDLRGPRVSAQVDRALAAVHPQYLVYAPEDPPRMKVIAKPLSTRDGLILVRFR